MKIQYSLPISFFFFLCFFFVVNGDAVTDVCKKVAQNPNVGYDFCVKALNADPKSQTATVEELGSISLKLIKTSARNVKSSIEKLVHDHAAEANQKTALKNCLQGYRDALGNIHEAKIAYEGKDYKTANVKLSAAQDAPSDCEEGFEGGLASELAQPSKDYSSAVAIGLAITNMV